MSTVWNQTSTLSCSGSLQTVCWSREGNYCITAGQDRVCSLWNPYRSREVVDEKRSKLGQSFQVGTQEALLLNVYQGHGQDVTDVAISPDSARFASVGGDKCAFVWDIDQGRIQRKLFGHDLRLTSCCFAGADGMVLLTSSDDKTVKCWDLRAQGRNSSTGEASTTSGPASCIQTLGKDVFRDSVTRVLVYSQHVIAASSMDGTVAQFDLRMGKCLTESFGSPISTMTLSHDAQCLLVSLPSPSMSSKSLVNSTKQEDQEDGLYESARLVLTELSTASVLSHYHGHVNSEYRLKPAFTPDDASIVCGSEDGSVFIWDLVEGQVSTRISSAHSKAVSCVDLARRGGVGDEALLTASFDGTAKLWTKK